MGTKTVTVYVRRKRKPFKFHKRLLCNRSDFFDKAFNGRFQEADGEIYLPDDDFGAFEVLVNFNHSNRLPELPGPNPSTTVVDFETVNAFYNSVLFPSYFLAEKLCMNELANRIMDMIQDVQLAQGHAPSVYNVETIYPNTHAERKLRIYCVLMLLQVRALLGCDENHAEWLTKSVRDFPDFAMDFIRLQGEFHAKFYRSNKAADAQKHNDREGFGRCFLHTHTKREGCHLEGDASGRELILDEY